MMCIHNASAYPKCINSTSQLVNVAVTLRSAYHTSAAKQVALTFVTWVVKQAAATLNMVLEQPDIQYLGVTVALEQPSL